MYATVRVGRQGRLVIPVQIRAALGMSAGDQVGLRVDGSKLVIERPEDALAELRRLGDGISRQRSLVDELLAQRRAEAAAE